MSYNLSRNTRAFFTTDVDPVTGVVDHTNLTPANTFEIQILDGYSFTQNTQAETVTLSEGGEVPTRGQRSFNTALDPVDWSVTTYMRPAMVGGKVTAEDAGLWGALAGGKAINTAPVTVAAITGGTYTAATGVIKFTGTAMTGVTGLKAGDVVSATSFVTVAGGKVEKFNAPMTIVASSVTEIEAKYLSAPAGTPTFPASMSFTPAAWVETASSALVHFGDSNRHQLAKFGMIFLVDSTAYIVDNAAMDQVSIDFGLDAIAQAAWSGKGTALRQINGVTASSNAFAGGNVTGSFKPKNTTAGYIANKLSTLKLIKNIGGVAGTNYNVAITGGNLTIANNITYLTPSNLGVVNTPITYFTGTRAITGNVTAYLRGIPNGTVDLLTGMLANSSTAIDPGYFVQIEMGGATNPVRVELEINNAVLQIPTVNVEQVVSTQINFTAQGYTPTLGASATSDIAQTNEVVIRYYGV